MERAGQIAGRFSGPWLAGLAAGIAACLAAGSSFSQTSVPNPADSNASGPTTTATGTVTKPAEASSASFSPGVAEVVKLLDSGVSPEIVKAYVQNSTVAYHLSADALIGLNERHVPSEIVVAMLKRGSELRARFAQVQAAAQANAAASAWIPPAQGGEPTGPEQYVPAAQPIYSAPADYSYAPYSYYWYNYSYPAYPSYSLWWWSYPGYYYGSAWRHYGYRPYGYGHFGYGYPGYRSPGYFAGHRQYGYNHGSFQPAARWNSGARPGFNGRSGGAGGIGGRPVSVPSRGMGGGGMRGSGGHR